MKLMNNIKRSFRRLEDWKEWAHYALLAGGIYYIFAWLMDSAYLAEDSSAMTYMLFLFGTLVVLDRIVHGVLGMLD